VNVSAPVSVPDSAALMLAATPAESGLITSCPIDTASLPEGAETPSFESALVDLMLPNLKNLNGRLPHGIPAHRTLLEEAPMEKADKEAQEQDPRPIITGLMAPVCAPEKPPLSFSWHLQFSPQTADPIPPDVPIAFGQPDAVQRLQTENNAPSAEDCARAPELPHAAFVERFTAVPAVTDARATVASPAQPSKLPCQPGATGKPNTAPAAVTSRQESSDRTPDHQQTNDSRHDRESAAQQASEPEQPQLQRVIPVPAVPKPAPPADPALPTHSPTPGQVSRSEAEPVHLQPAPVVHNADAHSISLRVTDAADQRVDLKVTERAGDVRVAVRAADPELAGSLRENLGELVHKLEQNGFHAENWSASAPNSADGTRQPRPTQGDSLGDAHSRGQQDQGDSRDRRQQDRSQQAAWIEELEAGTSDLERNTNIWHRA
jgi:hypothetical protein